MRHGASRNYARSSAMGSLAQKVDTLREQLGLVDGLSFAESVNVAVFQLGLAAQVKGFKRPFGS